MAAPLVSVIILNWDGKEYLANCFDSLYHGAFQDFEIIFSDNVSSDGSVQFVREYYPQVRVIENDHYMGITAANNQAVGQA
ncbi:MAG: glycosyltransferase, partial [Acidobacteria bacterium]|nr:glycosyltransferase [Acidobacteriota bacterium]